MKANIHDKCGYSNGKITLSKYGEIILRQRLTQFRASQTDNLFSGSDKSNTFI